jgi:dCMP deaminase
VFNPRSLKAGDVIEVFSHKIMGTIRAKVIQDPDRDEMFCYFVPLSQDGDEATGVKSIRGLDWSDSHTALFTQIIGKVDGGPLAEHKRKDWDAYFMGIAKVVAERATCNRKHVGAIIVKNKTILSTGYNGSIRGTASCDERGHMMEDGHCVRTVHAEANAIIQAAKNGVRISDAEIYTTASPCWPCFKLIANAGIKRIVFGELYRDDRIHLFCTMNGIEEKVMTEKKDE